MENEKVKPVWKAFLVIFGIGLLGIGISWALCLHYIPKEQERLQTFLGIAVNLLILMAMFVQASITSKQWDVAEKTIRLTEQTFYKAQRAYLSIEHISSNAISPNVPPDLQLVVINGGLTPAFNVNTSVKLGIYERRRIAELQKLMTPFDGRAHLGRIIQAQKTANGRGNFLKPFNEMDCNKIFSEQMVLYARIDLWFFDIEDTGERNTTLWYEWSVNFNQFVSCNE